MTKEKEKRDKKMKQHNTTQYNTMQYTNTNDMIHTNKVMIDSTTITQKNQYFISFAK